MSIVEETQVMEENPSAAQAAQEPPPLWRNRDFMLLWGGQVISTLGTGIQGVVFPLLILALTNSPQAAGIAGALGTIPYVIFSLPAGALVDRWDRKRVMIISDVFRALNLLTVPLTLYFNALTVWQLFIVAFIEGTFFVWFNIAEVAALPRVVPRAQLPNATAQNQAGFTSAVVIAPSIGGFLYQAFGAAVPFLADSISYAVSVLSLLMIKSKFQVERAAVVDRHLGREIREGLAWLWHNPLVRFMSFLTGGLNLAGAATGLIVIVIARNLGATEGQIGILFSIWAVGGIIGSIVAGPLSRRYSFGQVIIASVVVPTLIFPLIAFVPRELSLGFVSVPAYVMLGAVAAVASMAGPIYNVVQFSYRLALIPDELQGRVNSSFRLLAFGFQPLGAFLAGVLLEQVGGFTTVMVFFAVEVFLSILVALNSEVRNAKPIGEVQGA